MKRRLLSALSGLLLSFAAAHAQVAPDGFRPLFNGKDLTDWDGNPALWSVEEGCITGKTAGPETLAYNQFLIWRGGVVKNFELRAKVKVTGNNSGLQYRSMELPEVGQWSVGGYQCDIHPTAKNNTMLYEEKARGIVAPNGQSVVAGPQGQRWLVAQREPVKVDVAEWHEYTVISQGNRLTHKLDGQVTAEFTDHDEKARALDGVLAFQIHRGPAMQVQIKDVLLKELPAGGVMAFSEKDLPAGAKEIGRKKANATPEAAPAATAPADARKPAARKRRNAPAAAQPADAATPAAAAAPTAPAAAKLKVAPDFKVETVYEVPLKQQGSWVALTLEDKGRLLASDQGAKGLFRITGSDGDDRLDKAELLSALTESGEHGDHAVVDAGDGRHLFAVGGNHTPLPAKENIIGKRVQSWQEDLLLPRQWDPRSHARGVLAPGVWVTQFDPAKTTPEVFCIGFRNHYDVALNAHGDIFTYDSDMEWDIGLPWYRPTRNACFHGEHGLADKWYPHEENIRVPLIMRDPRMAAEKRGMTNDAFTLNADLAPTILAATGTPAPARMQGRDFAPLYLAKEKAQWGSEFFYEHAESAKGRIPESEALVRKDWKYMHWPVTNYEQLFDLTADPREENDLARDPKQSARLAEMRTRFSELKAAAK